MHINIYIMIECILWLQLTSVPMSSLFKGDKFAHTCKHDGDSIVKKVISVLCEVEFEGDIDDQTIVITTPLPG